MISLSFTCTNAKLHECVVVFLCTSRNIPFFLAQQRLKMNAWVHTYALTNIHRCKNTQNLTKAHKHTEPQPYNALVTPTLRLTDAYLNL